MIKKRFDCVELKHEGAEFTAEKTSGLSQTEELDYWKFRTQELIESKNAIAKKPGKRER